MGRRSSYRRRKIPAKHKLATCQLAAGDPSYMYGVLVGEATKPSARSKNQYGQPRPPVRRLPANQSNGQVDASAYRKVEQTTFDGFYRQDGSVGTANYWLVLPMVFAKMVTSRL